ncbi:MAG: hypothetical protein IPI11_14610 [Haliscomenobacter sp.]|nr:hypothetical protein [Haliscomenobacter sp.]
MNFKLAIMEGSEKLMAKIKQQQIKPRPKWHLWAQRSLTGAGFVVAVLLGALAFSILLFAIQQTDFNVLSHLKHSQLEFFLGLLPFFWIGLLILSLLTTMYGIRHSSRGYKFTLARQMGYSAALSILLGVLFFITGGASYLEKVFAIRVSLYESIQEKKIKLWMMPEQGQLAGQILEVDSSTFRLADFSGKTWTIDYDSAFIAPVVLLEPGEEIKLLGKMEGKTRFLAEDIRPWQGPGSRNGGRGGPPWENGRRIGGKAY